MPIQEIRVAHVLRKYIPLKPSANRPALPREGLTEFYRRPMMKAKWILNGLQGA